MAVSVAVDRELHARLEKLARLEFRSTSGQAAFLIAKGCLTPGESALETSGAE